MYLRDIYASEKLYELFYNFQAFISKFKCILKCRYTVYLWVSSHLNLQNPYILNWIETAFTVVVSVLLILKTMFQDVKSYWYKVFGIFDWRVLAYYRKGYFL